MVIYIYIQDGNMKGVHQVYPKCHPLSLPLSLWLGGHLGHFPRFNDVGKCVKCKSKYSIRGAFSICEREGREQVYPPVFGPPIPSKYSH